MKVERYQVKYDTIRKARNDIDDLIIESPIIKLYIRRILDNMDIGLDVLSQFIDAYSGEKKK